MIVLIHPGKGNLNNSYFFGEDPINGWGNRTYFTYYSQFNRKSAVIPYLEAIILVMICLFSSIANSTILMILIRNRCLMTVTNIFICNLAMSDLLFTLSGPFIAACRITQTWVFGEIVCDIISYMEFVCGSVSIWTMTMISVERYICIVWSSSVTFTPRTAIVIIAVMWSIAMLCFTPVILAFHVMAFPFGNKTVNICTLQWPQWHLVKVSFLFTAFVLLVSYVLPLMILSWSYFKIFFRFWKTRRIMRRTRGHVDATWTTARVNIRRLRDARDLRVVKIVFCLVIIFAIMWSPIYGVILFINIDQYSGDLKLGSDVFIMAVCFAMVNACVNPILYGVMNERVKAKLVSCVICRKDPPEHIGLRVNRVNKENALPRGPYCIQPIQ